jgi:hypothetical protein
LWQSHTHNDGSIVAQWVPLPIAPELIKMADNEEDLVDYDEEEVRLCV